MARKVGSSGAETAQKLRQSALTLFAKDGYAAVSMRAIAAKTGVQAGAIYNHFPNKQDLLKDLMVVHMETLLAAWEEVDIENLGPAAQLESFVRFHVRYHLRRSKELFISYMELRSLEEAAFCEVRALRREYEAIPRTILERGKADWSFSLVEPDVTAMAIIAALNGISFWYKESGRLSVSEIEDIYIALAGRMAGQIKKEVSDV